MRVTVLELPARWNALEAVLSEVSESLERAAPGDLVLLPEASLTGYVSPRGDADLSSFAEPRGGPTAQRLSALAKRFSTTVVGPVIERDGERCFNALAAFGPDGTERFHYRKRHPWYVETWASAGENALPVIRVAEREVTAAICFDIHFIGEGVPKADVLLFASAWVDEDDDARATLLPDFARAHAMSIVNANWGVGSPRLRGQGGSMVVGKDGAVLARCDANTHRLDVELP